MPERRPPDDPREWVNRAQSDLAIAQAQKEDIYLEDLCFHAQQAAEKAIKALLIQHKVEFPYIHDIGKLLKLLEGGVGQPIPEAVKQSKSLSPFAVLTRYPGIAPPISQEEYNEAVTCAETVVRWAEDQLGEDS